MKTFKVRLLICENFAIEGYVTAINWKDAIKTARDQIVNARPDWKELVDDCDACAFEEGLVSA